MAGKTTKRQTARKLADNTESRLAASFFGCGALENCNDNQTAVAREREKFRNDFLMAVRDEGNGLLTRHLFFDPKDYQISGQIVDGDRILWGSNAWDAHELSSPEVDFGDASLVKALVSDPVDNILLTSLPGGTYSVYEYGPGEQNSVRTKSIPFVRSLVNDPSKTHRVSGYTSFDIVPSYAVDSARLFNEELGLNTSAIVGNAYRREPIELSEHKGNDLVAIFGGMLMNAPEFLKEGRDSREVLCDYFATINLRHGVGSYIFMTLDIERDVGKLLKRYEQTPAFACFSLSGIARAVHEGVITDRNYDVLGNWEAVSSWNATACRIEIDCIATKDHTMTTVDGDIEIKKGHKISSILSAKNPIKDIEKVANVAGVDLVDIFPQKQQTKCGILLKVARPPAP
ncbi:MAG: hypothetical protein GC136_00220 [Alphaproteobacteria bacterium]|nr:hypothetical protein [Alphaproteobacteria bacterium]